MADFNSLTDEQKAQIAHLVPLMRSSLITMSKAINSVAGIAQVFALSLAPAVSALEDTAVIPDNTGLAGAVPLTKADVMLYISTATGLLTAFNTPENRTLILRAVGPANVIS